MGSEEFRWRRVARHASVADAVIRCVIVDRSRQDGSCSGLIFRPGEHAMCIRRINRATRGVRLPTRIRPVGRRAFTLVEALMATGLLLVVVVAVSTAITAGQQQAYEAHQRIAASLAAEELMGRIAADDYASLLTWNGHTEN